MSGCKVQSPKYTVTIVKTEQLSRSYLQSVNTKDAARFTMAPSPSVASTLVPNMYCVHIQMKNWTKVNWFYWNVSISLPHITSVLPYWQKWHRGYSCHNEEELTVYPNFVTYFKWCQIATCHYCQYDYPHEPQEWGYQYLRAATIIYYLRPSGLSRY